MGSLEPSQPLSSGCLALFVFLAFFFSSFFGLIVLIKSFCPVLFFTG